MSVYDDLAWRGLVNQVSDEARVREYMGQEGASLYCGFDPTAKSLHVGNLVPLLSLARCRRAGLAPIFLLGGATGLIGDPSGKDKERELMTKERLDEQAANIERQVNGFFERNTGHSADVVNNYHWTEPLSAIELLRDVGKHFTINWMLGKESVKNRIGRDEVGISYTEFSYMILQAFDFYHLYKERGCRLQIGGGDQWGNITAGCELIRRKTASDAFALTFPLITTASGRKFGKSEQGAVYLSSELTSPYAFYQYFINAHDQDVVKLLKYFTFLSAEQIAELEAQATGNPAARDAQRALAREVTIMIHGEEELAKVEAATAALFGKGDVRRADPKTLKAAMETAPSMSCDRAQAPDLPQMLADLGLCKSKGQARKDIRAGGVYVNGERVQDEAWRPTAGDFLGGEVLLLRKGKKNWGLVVAK
ncbi:MAG: tyrosine--tRNA ligase [Desulfovibrionaceae bacterium]